MTLFDIAVIGGDSRLVYMADALKRIGYSVICYGTFDTGRDMTSAVKAGSLAEALSCSKCVAGGIPFSRNNSICAGVECPDLELPVLFENTDGLKALFGGLITEEVKEHCKKQGICCCDYMKDEALSIFNAVPTAEGAILDAMKNHPAALHGSGCLILGYGRCAKVLAEKLKGLSAEVTVCCRNEQQRAAAQASGFLAEPLERLPKIIQGKTFVFNTVPGLVLEEESLVRTDADVLIIDIASGKGGVDFECARKLRRKTMLVPGLPGRYAPQTSGEGFAAYINRQLKMMHILMPDGENSNSVGRKEVWN
ncbi:dipicolinate synthase [Ruminococcus sp. OA3]|uniref:dipicolinate synthase subunit DpsA n=1 Tax=Ruminococcus sp. OA3 TaxID=2914164 RepID=UPI001F0628ED|nr:dipicolinate synthase [Ruminococcus sp. OA3]